MHPILVQHTKIIKSVFKAITPIPVYMTPLYTHDGSILKLQIHVFSFWLQLELLKEKGPCGVGMWACMCVWCVWCGYVCVCMHVCVVCVCMHVCMVCVVCVCGVCGVCGVVCVHVCVLCVVFTLLIQASPGPFRDRVSKSSSNWQT